MCPPLCIAVRRRGMLSCAVRASGGGADRPRACSCLCLRLVQGGGASTLPLTLSEERACRWRHVRVLVKIIVYYPDGVSLRRKPPMMARESFLIFAFLLFGNHHTSVHRPQALIVCAVHLLHRPLQGRLGEGARLSPRPLPNEAAAHPVCLWHPTSKPAQPRLAVAGRVARGAEATQVIVDCLEP